MLGYGFVATSIFQFPFNRLAYQARGRNND
jgi:hypothetical protein